MYKINQKKTVYFDAEGKPSSKWTRDCVASDVHIYGPWWVDNNPIRPHMGNHYLLEIPQDFNQWVKGTLRRPGDRPLNKRKRGEWKGNEWPCLSCADCGELNCWAPVFNTIGCKVSRPPYDCPYCDGTGASTEEQLRVDHAALLVLKDLCKQDQILYNQEHRRILDKLTVEEIAFVENHYSCDDCC